MNALLRLRLVKKRKQKKEEQAKKDSEKIVTDIKDAITFSLKTF